MVVRIVKATLFSWHLPSDSQGQGIHTFILKKGCLKASSALLGGRIGDVRVSHSPSLV